jgi:hypothetical protein
VIDPIPTDRATIARSADDFAVFQDFQAWAAWRIMRIGTAPARGEK